MASEKDIKTKRIENDPYVLEYKNLSSNFLPVSFRVSDAQATNEAIDRRVSGVEAVCQCIEDPASASAAEYLEHNSDNIT